MRSKYLIIIFGIILLSSCKRTNDKIGSRIINYDSLRIVLEGILEEDQEIRRILVDSIGFDSPDAQAFIRKMNENDEKNQKNIKLILDNYGWIEQSKIGTKAADAFFYIIQHSDLELMDKWYPEFKRLADENEANKRQCAMMEDRLLMWKGKRQIYGTQAYNFHFDKRMAIWPIENPEQVNERRAKIGFTTTVEEYAKEMNAIFDINQKLPTEKN